MTGARREILSILENSSLPLSAAEIHRNSSRTMDVATVYRTLHYFEEQGVLESFYFTCSEKGAGKYYLYRRKPHIHFFHCSSCHRFIPLGECMLKNIEINLEEEHNLRIEDHILYFTGLCKDCIS